MKRHHPSILSIVAKTPRGLQNVAAWLFLDWAGGGASEERRFLTSPKHGSRCLFLSSRKTVAQWQGASFACRYHVQSPASTKGAQVEVDVNHCSADETLENGWQSELKIVTEMDQWSDKSRCQSYEHLKVPRTQSI